MSEIKPYTFNELVNKIKQYREEYNLSDTTCQTAYFWTYLSCMLGLKTDVFSSENHITVVPVNKKEQLSVELGIYEDKPDFIDFRKGFGMDFETIYDEDDPSELIVLKILDNLRQGKLPTE